MLRIVFLAWVGSFPVEKSSPDVNPIQVTNEHKIELKVYVRAEMKMGCPTAPENRKLTEIDSSSSWISTVRLPLPTRTRMKTCQRLEEQKSVACWSEKSDQYRVPSDV
ncbi:hypothetical protein T4B_8816 [Trichinella pseudospiralis]|uniref:Uncharacterized protein n=1 Tax=Trichinella pseudospiralis TaxID=6337 RepID=A0A0V1JQ45_TRIPS|nr:hypothetical protein T4A_7216 [Trichinella pseudospiralis]KRZ08984.1 hypothetical protein T4B_8816 [Trichinella pseudospiralis]KRZ37089.1 hypothetical protein T4C_5998 [Trichinella pseudospiralis]